MGAKLRSVIFSKNRAMQLQALLESFELHSRSAKNIHLSVLYKVDDQFRHQYVQLEKDYPDVLFVEEVALVKQLVSLYKGFDFLFMQADDNIFIRKFSLVKIMDELDAHESAIGFSLRLGLNINQSYMTGVKWTLKDYKVVNKIIIKFNWVKSSIEFGYPLEATASVYRVSQVGPIIVKTPERTPSGVESNLNRNRKRFREKIRKILCYRKSAIFSVPVNVVQIFRPGNRFGIEFSYSVEELANKFDEGYRINVQKFSGIEPVSTHQEVEFEFVKGSLR